MKKVLVLGGTGAMGIYLVPKLLERGFWVDIVSLDEKTSDNEKLKYIKANALDDNVLAELLKNKYDGIVDFMVYKNTSTTFKPRMTMFLDNCEHYIYLSSYRIYANEDKVITEESPRLLETATEPEFLAAKETEYSLYKAIGEDMLNNSKYSNYTIVRPAITYSSFRFQLTVLEAENVIGRMLQGKTLVLPESAMDKQATMSWAGDVAEMLARILFNEKCFGETYTVSTNEHHTWREIAEMYKRIGGLKYVTVDNDTFFKIYAQDKAYVVWQLEYDRMYDRVIDNSKILRDTGMKQSELMILEDGLKYEFSRFPKDYKWNNDSVYTRMDEYLKTIGEV